MGLRDDIPSYLEKAADLFFEELGSHLDTIEKLASNAPGEAIPTEAREEIAQRFHTIRGGAGFLKIDALQSTATAGEKESSIEGITKARILALTKELREILSRG